MLKGNLPVKLGRVMSDVEITASGFNGHVKIGLYVMHDIP